MTETPYLPNRGSAPLVDRVDERHYLRTRLRRLAAGAGGVIVVEGPPGIGKTRLLEEAAHMARSSGVSVVASRAEERVAFARLAPLLMALRSGASPILADDELATLPDAGDGLVVLLERLRAALERKAISHPLLFVVDDLQWADPATLVAVTYLTETLAPTPLLWLLAVTTGEHAAAVGSTLDALARGGRDVLRIGPIPAADVATLALGILGTAPPTEVASLLERADGNPFLVVEALRAITADERGGGLGDLDLSGIGARRLRDAPPEVRRLLEVAAVLCRFDVAVAATVLDVSVHRVLAPLQVAIAMDVLIDDGATVTWRHELLRRSVADSIPASIRRELHRRAATALADAQAPPAVVAPHVFAAADRGETSAALLLAGAAELSDSDRGTAIAWCERVLELLPTDSVMRGDATAALCRLLVAGRRVEDAAGVAERELSANLGPADQAVVRTTWSTALARLGAFSESRRVAAPALDLPDIDDEVRRDVAVALAASALYGGDADGADELSATVWSLTDPNDPTSEPAWIVTSLIRRAAGRLTDALEAAERALAVAGTASASAVDNLCLHVAVEIDEASGVEPSAWPAPERAATASGPVVTIGAAVARSIRSLALGRFDDATAEVEAAITIAEHDGAHLDVVAGELARGVAAWWRGDIAAIDAVLGRADGSGIDRPALRALGFDWLVAARHELAGAHEDLSALVPAIASADRWPLVTVGLGLELQVARVAHETDDRRALDTLAAATASLAAANPSTTWARAQAAMIRALVKDDVALALTAVDLLGNSACRPIRAGVLEATAGMLLAAGRRDEAGRLLVDVAARWADLGAAPATARVRARLRDLGIRQRTWKPIARPSSGWASLTDTEHTVARIVAEGYTNAQAARRLYMSPHTVAAHLRRIFAKLGIRSRLELVRLVASGATAP